jgi:hypothetical protein
LAEAEGSFTATASAAADAAAVDDAETRPSWTAPAGAVSNTGVLFMMLLW